MADGIVSTDADVSIADGVPEAAELGRNSPPAADVELKEDEKQKSTVDSASLSKNDAVVNKEEQLISISDEAADDEVMSSTDKDASVIPKEVWMLPLMHRQLSRQVKTRCPIRMPVPRQWRLHVVTLCLAL